MTKKKEPLFVAGEFYQQKPLGDSLIIQYNKVVNSVELPEDIRIQIFYFGYGNEMRVSVTCQLSNRWRKKSVRSRKIGTASVPKMNPDELVSLVESLVVEAEVHKALVLKENAAARESRNEAAKERRRNQVELGASGIMNDYENDYPAKVEAVPSGFVMKLHYDLRTDIFIDTIEQAEKAFALVERFHDDLNSIIK